MKVILSRKGFDSSNGGCPSPIMPDGTLLSMPIPSNDEIGYDELLWGNDSYKDILGQLKPRKEYGNCHLDPDIRGNIRKNTIADWKPAFGQISAAQGVLNNAGVEPGDLFLFFGWFRPVEKTNKGYRFVRKDSGDFYSFADMQVIYGYMQVGEIIKKPERIREYYWHPHSSKDRTEDKTNALYIPVESLSFDPSRKGYGVLDFRKDRVLTMEGKSRGVWNEYEFLKPEHIYGKKKNSAKDAGLYYCGIWQELVVFESDGLLEWVREIIR